MNGRKAKRLRKRASQLLIRWIRSMIPLEKMQPRLLKIYMSSYRKKHIFANNKLMVSAYTLRWFYKR